MTEFDNLAAALTYAAEQVAAGPAYPPHLAKSWIDNPLTWFIYLGTEGVCCVTTSPAFDDFVVALAVTYLEDGPSGPGIYTAIVSTSKDLDLGEPLPVLLAQHVKRWNHGNCPMCSMPIQREKIGGTIAECPACSTMLECREGNWELMEGNP